MIQAIAIEDFSTSANRTADLAFQTRKDGTFTEHMRIDSSGNVGIGTTSPSFNVHVSDSSGVTDIKAGFLSGTAGPGIRGQNTSTTANTYFPIDFRCNDADARIAFQYSGASNQGQFLFITEAHSTSPKLGIYDRGTVARVLVNDTTSTGTPTKTFEVKYVSTSTDVTQQGLNGGGVGKGLLIYNTQESDNVYANLDFRARNADGRIAYQYQTATNVGDFHFITDNGASPQSMMTIKNDGNVGIGTTSPAFKLQVQTPAVPTNSTYVVGLDVSRPNSANRGFTVGSNSAADTWTLGAHNADIQLGHTFGTDTGGQPTFYPDVTIKHSDQSLGSVGIGTTAPAVLIRCSREILSAG